MSDNGSKYEPVILSAARTPIGKLMGGLSSLSAPDLGAISIKAAIDRAGIDPSAINETIMGQVVQAGSGQAPARQAAIKGGVPPEAGAVTINKICGSGLKAVMMAASAIRAGDGDLYIAGGMESMSQAPFVMPKARTGQKFGHTQMLDTNITDGLWCAIEDWMMGDAAEFIAQEFDITRQEMDEFAYLSHQKALDAIDSGRFNDEIVPVEIKTRKGTIVFDTDEAPRRDTSVELLANLPPAFQKDGRVTAGNAPGLNDGGAAVIVTSRVKAEALGIKPIARIVAYGQAAVEAKWLFHAPAKAMPIVLEKADWSLDDVDVIELNEAFAAQALANGKAMKQAGHNWDWDKVNVNGGAIALGHPIGCSGTRVLVTLLHALKQHDASRGIAALCLGGGEAVGMAVELEV